ncbi:LacI family DNA-binding transcriptional regulator [Vibrio sinaloensis]|uniref:LacI family transcriptional regulator n=1 Tax=Photobacterium sp. (strain ATCC 43367) TaxID=379097 RepID=A0A0A5HVI3_PHOS4|nr:LacI family DNA-binding transcriptional regulator [Vibrio sinaloensis]KGY08340.1 LacI family transcriptional regulator [Vibrio sinaloensis]
MATISDVSRMAGVSKATVSRVINGTGQVKESTRLLVESVMKDLNYKPSSVAQALATKRGNSIGLVLSDFTGSYFGLLLKQASISADKMGKQLLIADGHNQAEYELQAVHSLVEKKCDVVILYSRMLSEEQVIALNQSIDVPLINVGRRLPESAGFSVSFDQQHAVTMAVDHLVDLGHRAITYIGPSPDTPTSLSRLEGYLSAVEKHKIKESHRSHISCSFGFIEGYSVGQQLVTSSSLPNAIVTASDDIAIGCIKAFSEHGISVPKQISIVSIDNDPCSAFVTPSLTTVDLPIRAITERAMDVAQQAIEQQCFPPAEVIQGSLIIRHSTKAL